MKYIVLIIAMLFFEKTEAQIMIKADSVITAKCSDDGLGIVTYTKHKTVTGTLINQKNPKDPLVATVTTNRVIKKLRIDPRIGEDYLLTKFFVASHIESHQLGKIDTLHDPWVTLSITKGLYVEDYVIYNTNDLISGEYRVVKNDAVIRKSILKVIYGFLSLVLLTTLISIAMINTPIMDHKTVRHFLLIMMSVVVGLYITYECNFDRNAFFKWDQTASTILFLLLPVIIGDGIVSSVFNRIRKITKKKQQDKIKSLRP